MTVEFEPNPALSIVQSGQSTPIITQFDFLPEFNLSTVQASVTPTITAVTSGLYTLGEGTGGGGGGGGGPTRPTSGLIYPRRLG